ncbi:MAG: hypothetical protein AABY22_29505 [Nanoarchaeota archaeon]
MEQNIVVYGAGHYSVMGELEGKIGYWSFGLEIDGEEIPAEQMLDLHSKKTRNFYTKIKPYLPDNYLSRMIPPVQVPDSVGWSFDIPLKDFKNPDKVLKILEKYFPEALDNINV